MINRFCGYFDTTHASAFPTSQPIEVSARRSCRQHHDVSSWWFVKNTPLHHRRDDVMERPDVPSIDFGDLFARLGPEDHRKLACCSVCRSGCRAPVDRHRRASAYYF